jgi:hypothetical protein
MFIVRTKVSKLQNNLKLYFINFFIDLKKVILIHSNK